MDIQTKQKVFPLYHYIYTAIHFCVAHLENKNTSLESKTVLAIFESFFFQNLDVSITSCLLQLLGYAHL